MSSQLVWLATIRLCAATLRPLTVALTPMIHAAAPRNRGGTGERRSSSLSARWIGAQARSSRTSPAMRRTARPFRRAFVSLAIAIEGDAVELHAMIDEAKAELFGDALLEHFQLIVDELDHVAGLHVDQMVVMGFRRRFVAGSAVSELMGLENASFLEQAHGP